jgi:protein involved in plasmid replication-relaxation
MAPVFRTAIRSDVRDIRLLGYRDRAVLRILDRAEAATSRQLAILVYGNLRTAQERLAILYAGGLLERATVPPPHAGGVEYAYRLSRRARYRLGDHSPRARGSNRLGHTLDIVETISVLVTANGDPRHGSPVLAWLAEPTAATAIGSPPYPDSVVVLEDGGRSGVICLEIDEATQRRAVIEAKLNAYRRLFDAHPTWRLLFVVPSRNRARWLRAVARRIDETVAVRTWVTSLVALRAGHLDAPALPVTGDEPARMLRAVLNESTDRRTAAPVGSEAWLRLLGEGGIEDLDEVLG